MLPSGCDILQVREHIDVRPIGADRDIDDWVAGDGEVVFQPVARERQPFAGDVAGLHEGTHPTLGQSTDPCTVNLARHLPLAGPSHRGSCWPSQYQRWTGFLVPARQSALCQVPPPELSTV